MESLLTLGVCFLFVYFRLLTGKNISTEKEAVEVSELLSSPSILYTSVSMEVASPCQGRWKWGC